jgi:hypothetical protein
MRTITDWLGKFNLLKATTVAIVAIAVVAGTALAAGPLGAAAKRKKCNQTCQETNLFNALYAARIAKAHVAFATTAGSAASAGSAGSAATAKTVTGAVAGTQVAGPVASATDATSAANATSATSAASLTGTVNGAQVAGAVASATNAASAATATNVDGHTFTQIDAAAGIDEDATLLKEFGGLTLQCVPPPGPGTEGTVSLAISNATSANGSFGVGDTSNTSHFEEGPVDAAVGGIPVTTTFSFPVRSGAQVNFTFKLPAGTATDMVSGAFTLVLDNGCSAFGNAQASVS